MDLRRRAAAVSGAATVLLGCVAWALAATSMAAVQAAEARALGPGHTPEMPGEDELALVAHDIRLAGLVVVASGLALAVAVLPARAALASWLGGVVASVLANATLGRAVDDGSVLLAALGLLTATAAGSAAGYAVASRRDRPGTRQAPGSHSRWPYVTATALAAGMLPMPAVRGMWSERYVDWVPAGLATATVVTTVALVVPLVAGSVLLARGRVRAVLGVVLPLAAVAVLVDPAGPSLQLREAAWGVGLALASAPLLLDAVRGRWRATAVVLLSGVLLAAVPQLVVPLLIVGGMLGLLVTGWAGAYINYDGLPLMGAGLLIAVVLLVVHRCLRQDARGPATAPPEVRAGVDPDAAPVVA